MRRRRRCRPARAQSGVRISRSGRRDTNNNHDNKAIGWPLDKPESRVERKTSASRSLGGADGGSIGSANRPPAAPDIPEEAPPVACWLLLAAAPSPLFPRLTAPNHKHSQNPAAERAAQTGGRRAGKRRRRHQQCSEPRLHTKSEQCHQRAANFIKMLAGSRLGRRFSRRFSKVHPLRQQPMLLLPPLLALLWMQRQ